MLALFIWHHPPVGVDSAEKCGSGIDPNAPTFSEDCGVEREESYAMFKITIKSSKQFVSHSDLLISDDVQ